MPVSSSARAHTSISRHRLPRRLRLAILLARRLAYRTHLHLALFSGWVWVAAGSLVGFEALELLLGGLFAVPEALPIVLLTLALVWYFRRGIRRLIARVVDWARTRRGSVRDTSQREDDRA